MNDKSGRSKETPGQPSADNPAGRPDRWLRRRGPIYAVIALGGFAGGNARYALGLEWPDKPGVFPWTTFGINVSGALVLALLLVLILEVWNAPVWLRPLLATGFLGAFTTFSAVTFALVQFIDSSQWDLFLAYAGFSTLAGLAAASFGMLLGRAWVRARIEHGSRAPAQEGPRAPAQEGFRAAAQETDAAEPEAFP